MAVKFGEGVLAGPHADFLAQSWGSTVSLKGGIVPLLAFSSRSSRVNTDYSSWAGERAEQRDDRGGHSEDIRGWGGSGGGSVLKRRLVHVLFNNPCDLLPCITLPPESYSADLALIKYEYVCVQGWTWVETGGCEKDGTVTYRVK